MIAEVIAFDLSTSGMTVPLLIAAAIAVAGFFLLSKKKEEAQASTLVTATAGLFSGSRLTMLASLAALVLQAGSVRDLVKNLLAKLIDFANKEKPVTPPVEPKPEEPK